VDAVLSEMSEDVVQEASKRPHNLYYLWLGLELEHDRHSEKKTRG
jgi:hypothetical protein